MNKRIAQFLTIMGIAIAITSMHDWIFTDNPLNVVMLLFALIGFGRALEGALAEDEEE